MTAHEVMVERLVRAGMTRGRREMANLAYDMARTCLQVAQGASADHLRWFIEPRSIMDQRADLKRMSKRVSEPSTLVNLPLAEPVTDQAVSAGVACVEFTESIEGGTSRAAYLRALLVRASGDHAGAVDRIRHLLATPLTQRRWTQVLVGLQGTLFFTGDHEEVVSIGQRFLEEDSSDTGAIYNTLAAYAWLGMSEEFLKEAPRLTRCLIGVQDPSFWGRLIRQEAEAFAQPLAIDPTDVLGLVPDAFRERDQ